MAAPTTDRTGDACDPTPDFVYAVSLLAALEEATDLDGHTVVLPFLGMARAELVDFGQRRPSRLDQVEVTDLATGVRDLDARLSGLLACSEDLRQTLRLDSALGYLRRGIRATERPLETSETASTD